MNIILAKNLNENSFNSFLRLLGLTNIIAIEFCKRCCEKEYVLLNSCKKMLWNCLNTKFTISCEFLVATVNE